MMRVHPDRTQLVILRRRDKRTARGLLPKDAPRRHDAVEVRNTSRRGVTECNSNGWERQLQRMHQIVGQFLIIAHSELLLWLDRFLPNLAVNSFESMIHSFDRTL